MVVIDYGTGGDGHHHWMMLRVSGCSPSTTLGLRVVVVAVGQCWGELVDGIVVVNARSKVMAIAIIISREHRRSQWCLPVAINVAEESTRGNLENFKVA